VSIPRISLHFVGDAWYEICHMNLYPQSAILSLVLSLFSKTQPNHWAKRIASTQLVA